jgi:hypothetical protein
LNWATGRTFLIGTLSALALTAQARAADKVEYAPAPGWVKPAAIPEMAPDKETGAVQLLLKDDQVLFGPEGDDFYAERAFRIRTPQALESGNVVQSWNPDTETLVVHELRILRGGPVIDVLAGGKQLTAAPREEPGVGDPRRRPDGHHPARGSAGRRRA